MYITRIYIKNYKSISELDIKPSKWLNAFIWENSTWKSNIFKALDWLLWKSRPSFNQITKEDHFMWDDENNKIFIILEFDDWTSFCLNENEEKFKFKIENAWRIIPGWDDIRKKYSSAYLDTKREINSYMPSNKWSLLWRILQEVNTQFSNETMNHLKTWEEVWKVEYLKEVLGFLKDKILFSVEDKNWVKIMEKLSEIIQRETSEQLNRWMEEFNIDFNLYDPWNFYRTLQITVKEQNWLEFQASSLWMWVQASISIAILKAYSELNLNNNSPILIDEPELYLHPQAQRNFYNILRKVSQTTQIFYTTHSPDFLCTWNFNEIFLVRKSNIYWTYIKSWNVDDFTKDLFLRKWITSSAEDYLEHMQVAYEETWDSQKSNEAFFSNKVILVEWQSETLILPYLFKLVWFDYVKEWITIVRCGWKSELDRFYRLYTEFWIPCFVIFDGDKQNLWCSDEDNTIKKNKWLFEILDNKYIEDFPNNEVKEKYLWFEYRLEENLPFTSPVWSKIKSLSLFRKVKKEVNITNVPDWINELIIRVQRLKQESIVSVLVDGKINNEVEDLLF